MTNQTKAVNDMYNDIKQPNVNSVPSEFNGGLTYPQAVHELIERVNSMEEGTVDIKDGSVTSVKLADNSVVNRKIADRSVTTSKIADKAITRELLGDGEVTPEKISSVNVSQLNTVIPEGQVLVVHGGKVEGEIFTNVPNPTVSGKVLTSIQNGMAWLEPTAVPDIEPNSITNDMLAPNAVDQYKLADGAVTTSKYARNSITNEKLGINSVTNANIADGSLDPAKLSSLPPAEVGDKSITQAKMADNSVGSEQLIDGSVTSDKIAVASVNTTNLVDGSVTSNKLSGTGGTAGQVLGTTDGVNVSWVDQTGGGGELPPEDSITTAMLQDGSVTGQKLAIKAVSATNIEDGTITGQQVAMATLEADHVNSQGATVGQVLTAGAGNTAMWGDVPGVLPPADSITTEMLKSRSVTASKLDYKSVTDTAIADNAIQNTMVKDNQLSLLKLEQSRSFGKFTTQWFPVATKASLDKTITTSSLTPDPTTGCIDYAFASNVGSQHLQNGEYLLNGVYGSGTSTSSRWDILPAMWIGDDGKPFHPYYVTTGTPSTIANTCHIMLHPSMFPEGTFPATIYVKLYFMTNW